MTGRTASVEFERLWRRIEGLDQVSLDELRVAEEQEAHLVLALALRDAIEAQRALRSQRDVARRALREYASFAAWSYAQRLVDTLNMLEREVIGAVNHGDGMHTNPKVPPARELAHNLPWDNQCMCHRARTGPNPDQFFAIKLGGLMTRPGLNCESLTVAAAPVIFPARCSP